MSQIRLSKRYYPRDIIAGRTKRNPEKTWERSKNDFAFSGSPGRPEYGSFTKEREGSPEINVHPKYQHFSIQRRTEGGMGV
jgi:hypothetical protein